MTTLEFGPYFVILNEDGSLRATAKWGDPCVFKTMGPHDNHTKQGRRIVEAMIVVRDPLDRASDT